MTAPRAAASRSSITAAIAFRCTSTASKTPLLSTSLLVLDEPLTGAGADWYTERLLIITRTRDDRGLPTIVTSQLLPELLNEQVPTTPPPILSRWLSGLHVNGELGTDDVRLQGAL